MLTFYCGLVRIYGYVWGYLKQHELANLCAKNFSQLTEFARTRLRSMQHRSTLITAFWQQAELPL